MHISRSSDIATVILARRKHLGLSQQALADRIGASRKWVIEFERGNPKAEFALVLKALNELGITLTATSVDEGSVKAAPSGQEQLDIIDAIDSLGRSLAQPTRPRKEPAADSAAKLASPHRRQR